MLLVRLLTVLLLATCGRRCRAARPASSSSSSLADTEAGLYCDFEEPNCQWHWSARFVRISAAAINASIFSGRDPAMISGPLDDADGRTDGESMSLSFFVSAMPLCDVSF